MIIALLILLQDELMAFIIYVSKGMKRIEQVSKLVQDVFALKRLCSPKCIAG